MCANAGASVCVCIWAFTGTKKPKAGTFAGNPQQTMR